MPSISEILAAKKAKQAAAKPSSEDRGLTEAIDRIDPRGKSRTLVLTAAAAAPVPTVPQEDVRSLGVRAGEQIPLVPANADALATAWHQAANAFETELCIMQDPQEPEIAWLAVRPPRPDLPPILLHRLPWTLWPHPAAESSGPF